MIAFTIAKHSLLKLHPVYLSDFGPNDVVIESHRLIKDKGSYRVVGEVLNKSTKDLKTIKVKVSFYDKNKQLYDTGEDLLFSWVKAGEKESFKIPFGCCGQSCDMSNYDTYKISVEKGL